jgi:hypothetical protein
MGRTTIFIALSAMLAALLASPSLAADAGATTSQGDPQWQEIFGSAPVTIGRRTEVKRVRASDLRTIGGDPGAQGCWGLTVHQQHSGWWGYWDHWQHTTWCGNGYGLITYRYTEPHAAAGGLCQVVWGPSTWKTAGGVGYSEVRVRTQTGISCFGGWYHGSPWFEVAYTGTGGSWISGQGGIH